MKIFKKPFKKTHIGSSAAAAAAGGGDARSGEIAATSPSPTAVSPPCVPAAAAPGSPAAPAPPAVESSRAGPPPAAGGERSDYYSSEEEFQVQLAMALSASNSDFRGDPDGDQIRTATLLSLGRGRMDQERKEECASESLSRRYWDCNVLDYNEKVVDGFYDVFGLSADSGQGKMPSLVDLQTSIGDLGFEVIVVNRAIDPQLVELEQIAHCISLDSSAAQVPLLVQRISELVMEHMGGPVRDATDMLARWMEKSTELRTVLQTSLLPIGCIQIGLSRHRALLFKVLADNVGIPCRLVKGSHYTGVDGDAVNIIKLDNGREFLIDLMAAPGTLIPTDVPSMKDVPVGSCNPRVNKSLIPWITHDPGDSSLTAEMSLGEYNESTGNFGTYSSDGSNAWNKGYAQDVLVPSVLSEHSGTSLENVGSTSSANTSMFPLDHELQSSPSSSKQKEVIEVSVGGDRVTNRKLNMISSSQDPADSRNLFADLNPFQIVRGGKTSSELNTSDNRNTEQQRRRENLPSGPGRAQLPLVWKNRAPCNEIPNTKQSNLVEGPYPRKNGRPKDLNASRKGYSEGPSVHVASISVNPGSTGPDTSGSGMNDTSVGTSGYNSTTGNSSIIDSGRNHNNLDSGYALVSVESSGEKNKVETHTSRLIPASSILNELKEQSRNVHDKHDRNKCTYDRFMEIDMVSKASELTSSSSQVTQSRLDPMLYDVAECEIPWEHLVIGERIGLGSYGEVYRADWNGTEVAVKKFLDQDFYGDALDEFRSEVRIMRRLRHPNVVLFMGAVTRPPNLSIVSEFLPRGSLYRILHRPNCQIDERRRIKMALDVAKGMNCLHTSMPTIVHRDLKSPNLLVDKNWTVKVCDFGLSRLKHSTFLSSKSTAGTPEWMAPEVLRNEPSNEKCDVYSFGVILWELATLRMPWSGMNPMQVVGAVGFQDRRLDIPKELDPIVSRIIWECWQTDPNLRPSFAQLATALKSLQRLAIPSHQVMQNPPSPPEISVNSTP